MQELNHLEAEFFYQIRNGVLDAVIKNNQPQIIAERGKLLGFLEGIARAHGIEGDYVFNQDNLTLEPKESQ